MSKIKFGGSWVGTQDEVMQVFDQIGRMITVAKSLPRSTEADKMLKMIEEHYKLLKTRLLPF